MSNPKKTKFKLCTTHRYLPGQINKQFNDQDLHFFNNHRLRVFHAKPVVDSKPSKLDPKKWLDRKKLRQELIHAIAIDRENKELLKRINMINRKGGYVDTYNPFAYQRNNKWSAQEKRMKFIEKENKEFYKNLMNTWSHYPKNEYEAQWESTLWQLNHSSNFAFVILKKTSLDTVLKCQPSISGGPILNGLIRPLCFLEFKVKNGENIGRIIIELYYDYAPVTVQNFLQLCKGEDGLTYKNCLVHRIIKNQYLETGDITHGNGRGGFSIYGNKFQEENHVLKHSKAGVLSMKRMPPTDNNSQFCITFKRMEGLDHKNVVFGKIIKGNDNLFKIQDYARNIGKPYADIIISNCGEISPGNFDVCAQSPTLGEPKRSVGTDVSAPKEVEVCNTETVIKNCKCLPVC